ncbi:MAG: DUF2089 domain-containing protein [Thermotogae bacterium]|nr:DUF2089 domain-containing protein [Thermotogota bacterium]
MKVPKGCPICGGKLAVKTVRCLSCGAEITANFSSTPFDSLSQEQLDFLIEFLKTWGNFSQLARRLGVSYPTVRSKYAKILEDMGIVSEGEEGLSAGEVLDMLERGEIDVSEAERLLRGKTTK